MQSKDWIIIGAIGAGGVGAGVAGYLLATQAAPTSASSSTSAITSASTSATTTLQPLHITLVASEPKARTGQAVTLTAQATWSGSPPLIPLTIKDTATGQTIGTGTAVEVLATVMHKSQQTVSYQAAVTVNGIPYTSNTIAVEWSQTGTGTNQGRPNAQGQTVSLQGPTTATTGQMITVTATPTQFLHPVYQFWVLPPGQNWKQWGHYNTPNTWTIQVNAPGQWNFAVYAREASAPVNETATEQAYWEAKSNPLLMTVRGGSYVTLTGPVVVATQQTITLTAMAHNIPDPQYQFWYQAPGGSWQQTMWQTGTTATFPAGNSGQGTAIVYCRSNTNTYEYFSPTWAVTIGNPHAIPSAQASVTVSVPSHATLGETVTFTANSTGFTQPVYQFWYQINNGTWNSSGPYQSSDQFTLNASTPGTWRIVVNVRSALAPTNETSAQRAMFERQSTTQTMTVQSITIFPSTLPITFHPLPQ